MVSSTAYPQLQLRIELAPGVRFGPGKADLLEGIGTLGSIAGAGRRMRMSYKRAWQLVGELNRCFDRPLVELSKGGKGGGGANLTPLGSKLLERYRAMQAQAQTLAVREFAPLRRRATASRER